MMCIIRSNKSGLCASVGFHRSGGLSGGRGVASWGRQCPKLEGGYHIPGPYHDSFSDPVSLTTLPGPKGRRCHWPAGVLRLCSSLWVPSREHGSSAMVFSFDERVTDDFLIFLFGHHQHLPPANVLQTPWGVTTRPVWNIGRSAMAPTTAGTELMSWAVVNDTKHIFMFIIGMFKYLLFANKSVRIGSGLNN